MTAQRLKFRRVAILTIFAALSNSSAFGASACACFPFFQYSGWREPNAAKAQARARHVVVGTIAEIGFAGPRAGPCSGLATLTRIDRGVRYRAGETLRFTAPCAADPAFSRPPPPGRHWLPRAAMAVGSEATFYLSGSGAVMDLIPTPAVVP